MNRTKVDWLGFRTSGQVGPTLDALEAVFSGVPGTFGAPARSSGWMGYEQSRELVLDGMRVGLMAYGGDAQRGWVSVNVTGRGCEWVSDWDAAVDAVSALPDFEFRRVDVALDTFKGEVSHESVLAAHRAGQFTTKGRPPSCKQIRPEDPREGKTIYIGARDQGKFLRGYEKGYELISKFPSEARALIDDIDGVPIGDIYRLELEQKAKAAALPSDLIDRRDQYFAGAYPYLQKVLDVEPEIFAQRRERGPQTDLAAALANIRHQYGSTLFTALIAHHGDISAVWEKVVARTHNRALVEAGVLLVDHS